MEFKFEIYIKTDDETRKTTAKVILPSGAVQDFDIVHIEQSREILPLYEGGSTRGPAGFQATGKEALEIRLENIASPERRKIL